MTIAREEVTGLVLCGGRATRMGGADKGLLSVAGRTLAVWTMARLQPQVSSVMLSANRHLADYAAMGVPVWPDPIDGFAGPLAGWLAGLAHCTTPWMACAPCDSPQLPHDLVTRLARAADGEDAEIAMAAIREDGRLRPQPVFALLSSKLAAPLRQDLALGDRKVEAWAMQRRCVVVEFDDARAFFNVNTPADLQRLEATLSS